MTTFGIDDLTATARNRPNWTTIWEACTGPVFLVVDEEGNNVGGARIRHFEGRNWLYVDDADGYEIMAEDKAALLLLERA